MGEGRIELAVREVRAALSAQDAALAARVHAVGAASRRELAREARELQEELRRRTRAGFVPSFARLVGVSDLEKPMNRVLGWWAQEHADHGAGRRFVIRLAEHVGLVELAEDARVGRSLRVTVEQRVEEGGSDEPDLVIESERAVLLFENKVHAAESGSNQYASYLAAARRIAAGRRVAAVLAARQERLLPDEWTRTLLHSELAALFDALGQDAEVPAWSRVAAVITARSLRAEEGEPFASRVAAYLAREPESLAPRDVRAIRELLETVVPAPEPWRTT